MKYILDFDGVIFDTEKLKKEMMRFSIGEQTRSKNTFSELAAAFEKVGEFFDPKAFIFPDAIAFLSKHASECVVVSSYESINPDNNLGGNLQQQQREYQDAKITFAGITALLGAEHVHLTGLSKKQKLEQLQREYKERNELFCFVDDREVYIKEAEELGIHAFFMNRKKSFGPFEFMRNFERTHDVSSFVELEEKLVHSV